MFGGLLLFVATLCNGQEPPDTNYDESKVPPYELPHPLTCFDGRKVADAAMWQSVRRPEILQVFAEQVYGRTPRFETQLRFEAGLVDAKALEGLATRKEVRIHLFAGKDAPWMDLLLYVPNKAKGRVPVFLGLNYGNQGVSDDPAITPSRNAVCRRGEHGHRWPLAMLLERGYAVASFHGGDIELDRHGSGCRFTQAGWRRGIRHHVMRQAGRTALADDEWGSISAWAWGLSRALDYLETDSAIDGKRVAVFGHSRTGKTALWAGARDERFALVISNNSGQGGASLARRRYGESVAASYSLSGIWYCRNYRKYGNNESALPVDQHLLIALMAPRPVYVASATKDRWADPRGEFLAALNAAPAFRLFGLPGLGVTEMPAPDKPVGKTIGYHIRTGKHEITPYDWRQYLDFADRHFGYGASAGAGAVDKKAAAKKKDEIRVKASVSPMPTLVDKTLVAWVSLADTRQRGGSALTLIDPAERFDALVFGEIAPGKWMAGSDHFKRTQRDQAAFPEETAGSDAFVQVAVVYKGRDIQVFRNGKPYSRHSINAPQAFKQDAMVLIGLRYIGGMGPIGFLAGAVEEARIYNVALDQATIASLKPDTPSLPKPIGQWTFEDGRPEDVMGTFPPGELCGSARIADGKLFLDGKTAYMIAAPPEPPWDSIVQTLFYRANSRKTGRMWDTWLYLQDGTYHLYYLANAGRRWDNISMAVSSDGVHWREKGRLLYKRPEATWMGTGSTWRSPNHAVDGKYFMNFSEWTGPRQTIFFAESRDLLGWTRLSDAYEFKQDARWYKPNGRWDCIFTIPRPGGGLYGYWTATPKDGNGKFGFGETLDGIRWAALKPPNVIDATKKQGEVGAIEKINGRYYMMFGYHPIMVTLVADNPKGPFRRLEKNDRLLTGHTYFSRFLRTPDGVLVNHHSIADTVYFAPLKSAVVDAEGTLRLGWWQGNEKGKGASIAVKPPSREGRTGDAIAMIPNGFDIEKGIILEGSMALPQTREAGRKGLYIPCGVKGGIGVLLDFKGVAELGPIQADGSGFKAARKVDRDMTFGRPARFRLLLKHLLMEFYLDDILIACFSLPGKPTGRIGLIGGGKDLRAWNM